MGLDMFLNGRTKSGEEVELGYWRKHPDLHGFFVEQFAGGVDECQVIPLDESKLHVTLAAVAASSLPTTSGFFFGQSYDEDRLPTMKTLLKAIKWVQENPDAEVYYQASW